MLIDHIATAIICIIAMIMLGVTLNELWHDMPPVRLQDVPYYFAGIVIGAAIFPVMWVIYGIWN